MKERSKHGAVRSRALCQDFCKCCFLGSHTCGYHHPHLEPDSLWHRCWILGLLPGLCSWGSLEAEFPHSCPQPALDRASDELSAFDLHAWLSITGHGAPSFPALGPHGNVVFILAGMSPGGAQHQTPSPSFCQAAVVTPTPHPRLSLPSLWSGVWPAPWEGERENWEAGGLEGAIAAL